MGALMDFLSDLIAAVPVIGLLWLYNRVQVDYFRMVHIT